MHVYNIVVLEKETGRRRSFSAFFLGVLSAIAQGQFPGFLTIVAMGLLLSNTRAAFLASEWRPVTEDEDRPTRFNESLRDKLADQLPAKAWPVLQVPFFVLASLFVLLSLTGLGFLLLQRFGILPHAGAIQTRSGELLGR